MSGTRRNATRRSCRRQSRNARRSDRATRPRSQPHPADPKSTPLTVSCLARIAASNAPRPPATSTISPKRPESVRIECSGVDQPGDRSHRAVEDRASSSGRCARYDQISVPCTSGTCSRPCGRSRPATTTCSSAWAPDHQRHPRTLPGTSLPIPPRARPARNGGPSAHPERQSPQEHTSSRYSASACVSVSAARSSLERAPAASRSAMPSRAATCSACDTR